MRHRVAVVGAIQPDGSTRCGTPRSACFMGRDVRVDGIELKDARPIDSFCLFFGGLCGGSGWPNRTSIARREAHILDRQELRRVEQ